MSSYTIQGVKGSFEVTLWHTGADDIRIFIEFDGGHSFYRPTDRNSVEYLWIPNLIPHRDSTIEDGEGVRVDHKDGLYYIRHKSYYNRGIAIFTQDQMRQIIAALRNNYIEEKSRIEPDFVNTKSTSIVQWVVNGFRSLFTSKAD